jgi:hypothetical protein
MHVVHQKNSEPVEEVVQVKKGRRYKGRYVLKSGHKIWEINLVTNECKEAEYDKDINVDFQTKNTVKVLVEKENCIYIPCLNEENARKKFDKIITKVKGR